MTVEVSVSLLGTGFAPKALIEVGEIPAKIEKVSLYQSGENAKILIGEAAPSGGRAVFIDDFPDLSYRGRYLIKLDNGQLVEWSDNTFWPPASKYGWLRNAYHPYDSSGIRFIPRGEPYKPGGENFLAIDSGSELSYESNFESVKVLGSDYSVMLGGKAFLANFKISLILANSQEVTKAQSLLTKAQILCLQLPPLEGFYAPRTIFTPSAGKITRFGEDRAVLGLEITQLARPRNVYQPDRLIGVFNTRPLTWGQAQENARGYNLLALKAMPTILLGDKPQPLYDFEAAARWWSENAGE